MILEQMAKNMLNYRVVVKNTYEQNQKRLPELLTEINDIQHILGLNSHDAVALVKLAKELRKVLQERWTMKDELDLAKPLCELFDRHSKFFEDLERVSSDVDRITERHKNRKFTPRIRVDLGPKLIKQENNIMKLKEVMEMRNAR